MLRALSRLLARLPAATVALTLLLSAFAGLAVISPDGIFRIQVDPSPEQLLSGRDGERGALKRVEALFGDTDGVVVAVTLAPVFTAKHLHTVARIHRTLMALDGVREVQSLASAPNWLADDDDIQTGSFTQQAALDPSRIAALQGQFEANPLYRGSLVSADGNTAAFLLSLQQVDEAAYRKEHFDARIRAAVAQAAGNEVVPVAVTGSVAVAAATTSALLRTMTRTVPAVFVIVAALLLIAFRSLRVALASALTIGLALWWMMALAGAASIPVNLVTAIAPPLVVALGLSYSVHLLSDYLRARRDGHPPLQAHLRTLNRAAVPLLMNAVTTIASVLALMLSPMPAVREFALLAAFGTAVLALMTLGFLPAVLRLVGCGTRFSEPPGDRLARRVAPTLARFALRRRALLLGLALIIAVCGFWSTRHLDAGAEYIKTFSPGSQVRQDYETVNAAFGGATRLSILIETGIDGSLVDPAVARALDRFAQWLRAQPEVGSVSSYLDPLKLMHQAVNGNDPDAFVVPGSAAASKQLLLLGGGDVVRRTLNAGFSTALISLRSRVEDAAAVRELVTRIESEMAHLPPLLQGEVTGRAVLATRAVDDIVSGQRQSLIIAFLAIFVVLSALFMSLRAGLLAMLPNLVPVAVYFGALGLLDIPLSPTNSLVACIVLGIAVDDTIHFLARFNARARETADERGAVESALATVLRPITLTTLALCLSFLAFGSGELQTQTQFGVLAAMTLAVAWLIDLSLTPALGSMFRVVSFWDVLRVDLGSSPQYTIPLLAGLSDRQAKLFALLSKVQRVPAGTRVIHAGERSRDIYVVIEGQLEVWVQRGSEHRALSSLQRGATIGEAGYFGQRRTANVDTVSDARLLRFDSQDLERLRRRHPRIAATIFRNLAAIQAERLAQATAMID